jgi:hypothetical protein
LPGNAARRESHPVSASAGQTAVQARQPMQRFGSRMTVPGSRRIAPTGHSLTQRSQELLWKRVRRQRREMSSRAAGSLLRKRSARRSARVMGSAGQVFGAVAVPRR